MFAAFFLDCVAPYRYYKDMKATIVKIGNSRGLRIPRPILQECALKTEVEMEVRGHELIIRAPGVQRKGWESAFYQMAQRGDDGLVDQIAEPSTEWADKEWEW
jgi:antitoxin MazE